MSVQTLRDLTPANSPKKNKIVSLKYLTLSNNNDASDRGDKTPQTARLRKRDSSLKEDARSMVRVSECDQGSGWG